MGMALKQRSPGTEVVGYSRTVAKRELAVRHGAVDRAADSIEQACDGADVVVVAATVDHIAPLVIEAAEATGADCLITDVGSTKATIVDAVAGSAAAKQKILGSSPDRGFGKDRGASMPAGRCLTER